ncbi:MAG TPA: hypothetical protein VFA25_10445, partial [Actinomycetota bacterium]|nr:hypothetical protein [Actinomycetota bacterium]
EVLRVDPATNQVVQRIPLQSDYVRTVVAGRDGVLVEERVWEGNQGPCPVLTAIDPSSNEIVARQPTGDPCASTSSAAYRLIPWEGEILGEFGGPAGESFGPIDPSTALPTGDGFAFEPDHFPRGFLVPDETGFWYGAYPGGNGNRPDRLARMDPTSGEITDYMELHGGIAAAVLNGSLWTLNYDGTVTRIDLFAEGTASPSLAATETPTPTPTATRDGSTITASASDVIPIQDSPGAVSAIACGYDSAWIASIDDSEHGWLTRLDARTGETRARISTANVFPAWEIGGGGVTMGFGSVWIAGASAAKGEPSGVHAYLLRVDPTANEVIATIDLNASNPADVAIDAHGVWVMSFGLGDHPTMEVSLIDPTKNEIVATVPLDASYGHFLFAVDGWIVAQTNETGGDTIGQTVLHTIDPSTRTEVATTPLGSYAWVAAGDIGSGLWAIDGRSVSELAPASGQPIKRDGGLLNTGDALAVGEGGVWFIDPGGRNTIERFDPTAGVVDLRDLLPKGTTPIAMTTSPGAVWVLNYEGSVTRVGLT